MFLYIEAMKLNLLKLVEGGITGGSFTEGSLSKALNRYFVPTVQTSFARSRQQEYRCVQLKKLFKSDPGGGKWGGWKQQLLRASFRSFLTGKGGSLHVCQPLEAQGL